MSSYKFGEYLLSGPKGLSREQIRLRQIHIIQCSLQLWPDVKTNPWAKTFVDEEQRMLSVLINSR